MIKTGIISAEQFSSSLRPQLHSFDELKVIGFMAGYNMLTEKMLHSQAESLIRESQLSFFDKISPSFELVKYALRNQNNLYFNQIPAFGEKELKLLINLSHEAEASIQLACPLIFNSINFKEIEKIKPPFLANIRLSKPLCNMDEANFLQLILLLVLLDNGDFRKADLMTLPDENGTNVLEARLAFRSGSVARILLSHHFTPNETGIELFKTGAKAIRIQADANAFEQNSESETNTIRCLLQTINKQQALNLNFTHLYHATQIFRNLKSKINYSGELFSKNRFVG